MNEHETVVYQFRQEAFTFLGIENILSESSDFGYFWNHFFSVGGYDKILPYAVDPKPINVWYTKDTGDRIYFQGLMIENVDEVPDEYTLAKFPASDFLVVTHEWVSTNEEALSYGIDAGWKNIKTVQMPDGYFRNDGPGCPITVIEKENCDTPEGSRYEFWVPIKKVEE
ncbi:MAG: GyrI-like domain-containing protein [Oscillospiraceae bacterium]|nr:GyrI-like domain-containing protein [Oscillospiraceae bacterium]